MRHVSVIIPTMKGRENLLKALVDSLPSDVEIIIVDDENLLLAAKRNKGARLAKREYLLFIDDDNYLQKGAINQMCSVFGPYIGVMGMTACYDDKKLIIADGGSMRNYLTGFTTGLRTNHKIYEACSGPIPFGHYIGTKDIYDVHEIANAFMVRRDIFNEAGGFDEQNFPIDLDEADLCKRIKDMGYKIVMNPAAICYHKSQTYSHIPNFRRPMNAYFMGRNRVLYQRKHNNDLRYISYLVFFMPIFVSFYILSLSYRKNLPMIIPFLKGVYDGIFRRFKNKYQKR